MKYTCEQRLTFLLIKYKHCYILKQNMVLYKSYSYISLFYSLLLHLNLLIY